MARLKSSKSATVNFITSLSCVLGMITVVPAFFAQSAPPSSPSVTQSVQQILQQVHSSAATPPATPSAIGVTPEGLSKLKLAPGSMISVQVYEEPDFNGNYRLDDRGDISIPMVGSIAVGSLSMRQAEEAIHSKFIATGLLNEAHIVVNLVDYAAQYVVVSGEVVSPGRYAVIAPRKLSDVIATAGGLTITAGSQIVIARKSQSSPSQEIVNYRRNQADSSVLDTMVNPGDSVLVKRAGIVYVLGAVYRPGGYIMPDDGGLNVAGALSLAAGTSPEANIKRIRILRKKPDGSWTTFLVRLDQIQNGKAIPLTLQPQDIVYVAPSVLKEAALDIKSIAGGVSQAIIYRFY